MDSWERVVTAKRSGLYESNYLKANSPDGQRGLWIKHNLLRPEDGVAKGEFWAIRFTRDEPPVVSKREVAWDALDLSPNRVAIRTQGIELSPDRATGSLADMAWDLRLSGGQPPLHHLRWGALYHTGFPKKKLLTPAPNLRFDGTLEVGGERWDLDGWIGLRGHNWGTEHAHTYAYGNCNLWDGRAPDCTVDGFSAKVMLGGRPSPWLSSVVGRNPSVHRNAVRDWMAASPVVTNTSWSLAWTSPRRGTTSLSMTANPEGYAGLRYEHPDGRFSYCYNTKFADVRWEVGAQTLTSRCGELEILTPEPIDDIALHPSTDWEASQGDYRSPTA